MLCGSIKQLAETLIKYSFLAHVFLINSCNGCDVPNFCLRFLSTRQIDAFSQLPESHEFLKALGVIAGAAVVIAGVKRIQKIIVEIDKQDRRQQKQALKLPEPLYERINHRIGLDRKIKNEILERERLLTLRYPKEELTKKIRLTEQVYLEETLYDSTSIHKFACETGCAILNVPRRRKK